MMCSIVSKEISVQIKTTQITQLVYYSEYGLYFIILTRTVYPFDVANVSRIINLTEIG